VRPVLQARPQTQGVDEVVDASALQRRAAPVEIEGQRDVAERVEGRHEVERLEDEADPTTAQIVSSRSDSPVISVSPIHARPLVAPSSPAMMCMSVDFPEPDGPMIAVNSPRRMPTVTPSRARTRSRRRRRSW
jgi:hypothetical protein